MCSYAFQVFFQSLFILAILRRHRSLMIAQGGKRKRVLLENAGILHLFLERAAVVKSCRRMCYTAMTEDEEASMLRFVSERQEREWNDSRLSGRVKEIVTEASEYALERWGWNFTITSIYRTPAEDAALNASGIHVDWRAVDVRTREQSQAAIDDVTRYINGKWSYDPTRPNMKVCFSEPHGTGPHGHYQVHPRTKRK
jgi:hypothetical protein